MIITDPDKIKYRTALQLERDMALEQLSIVAADLNDRANRRRLNNKALVSENDRIMFEREVRVMASRDYEITSGRGWEEIPIGKREEAVKKASELIITQILNSKDGSSTIIQIIQTNAISVWRTELTKILPNFVQRTN